MPPRRNPFSLIGVDLGRRSVELVQLRRAGEGWKLHEAGRADLPVAQDDPASAGECARAIKRLRSACAFRGKDAAAALSIADLDVRPLRLPPARDDELRQMVRFEVEAYLQYPIDQAVVDYVATGEIVDRGERKTEVIAVCSRRRAVDEQLEVLKGAGLRARVVDVTPCALARALGQPGREAVAILDIGFETSAVAIVRGEDLIFCRRVDVGSQHVTQAIAEKLGLDTDRAEDVKVRHGLDTKPVAEFADGGANDIPRTIFAAAHETLGHVADEVQKSLRYCAANRRGLSATKLLMTGGGAMMQNVDQFLSERLAMPVAPGDPFATVEVDAAAPSSLAEDAPFYAVAVGLAKLEL